MKESTKEWWQSQKKPLITWSVVVGCTTLVIGLIKIFLVLA